MQEIEVKIPHRKKRKPFRILCQILGGLQPLFYMVLVGGLAWSIVYGRRLGILLTAVLVLLQILLWSAGRLAGKQEGNDFWYGQGKIGYAAFVLGLVFLAALFAVMLRPAFFYRMTSGIEGVITRTVEQVSGNSDRPEASGTIHTGNNYRTGTVQLEIRVSTQPTETLYLRGFSGGTYTGNQWEPADDDTVLAEAMDYAGWDDWDAMSRGMYYTMYYSLIPDALQTRGENSRRLTIRYVDESYEGGEYVLYFSQYEEPEEGMEAGQESVYQYYEQKDAGIDWSLMTDWMTGIGAWYQSLQDAYEYAARDIYTRVPEELLPRLTRLVGENPQENLNDITAFIIYTLQTRADYTLTPGWTPVNEDVVEYFLFESGEGYCQQFASAATLMYRLYGVPARYASGYALQPSDFMEQADGSWRAEVTDASAHAWAEIFLTDYGWVPVEVTPSTDGSIPVSYPGFDGSFLENLPDPEELRGNSGEIFVNGLDSGGEIREEGISGLFTSGTFRENWRVWTAAFVCAAALLARFLYFRKIRQGQMLEAMNCRQVFGKMMEMLHSAGYCREDDGSGADFPRKAAEMFPGLPEEDLRQVQEIVREAAYGETAPSEEQEEYVRQVCIRLKEFLSGKGGFSGS